MPSLRRGTVAGAALPLRERQSRWAGVSWAACSAMIFRPCGQRFVEFYPKNVKQESLSVRMVDSSRHMGVSVHIPTNGMKSMEFCRAERKKY